MIDSTTLVDNALMKYFDTRLLFLEISLTSKLLIPKSAKTTAMKDNDKAKLNFPKFCWLNNLAAYNITMNCNTLDTISAVPR